VRVRIPRDGVHVFDESTGDALHHPDHGDLDTLAPTGSVRDRD
jgi:hypothetical protein